MSTACPLWVIGGYYLYGSQMTETEPRVRAVPQKPLHGDVDILIVRRPLAAFLAFNRLATVAFYRRARMRLAFPDTRRDRVYLARLSGVAGQNLHRPNDRSLSDRCNAAGGRRARHIAGGVPQWPPNSGDQLSHASLVPPHQNRTSFR